MKRFIFGLIFIILTCNLAFPQKIFLRELSAFCSSKLYIDEVKKIDLKLENMLALNEQKKKKSDTNSIRKTGYIFVYVGGGVAIIGATLLAGAEGFEDWNRHEYRRYKKNGLILLGIGFAMIGVGYFMIRFSKEKRGTLFLSLNPFKSKAEIGYRVNF